jgi:hypothetical protein
MSRKDKESQKEYAKAYYQKNREASITRANARRDQIRKKIIDYKLLHPCKCGESHPAALDFHHKDEKEFCISKAYGNCFSWSRIEPEIAKCTVICRNCHAKLHWHKNL